MCATGAPDTCAPLACPVVSAPISSNGIPARNASIPASTYGPIQNCIRGGVRFRTAVWARIFRVLRTRTFKLSVSCLAMLGNIG